MAGINLNENSVVWDGERKGFYEAYYIQCNDPVTGMAWWFRYSLMIPMSGRGTPYCALWAVQFDQSGTRGPIAMKHVFPISHYRFEKERFILYIEDGFVTNSHATGKIRHGDKSLEWDIQWTPVDNCFVHYPKILYRLPFPRTKVVSPHWATTGGGFIRWNDGEFYMSDALIHVGHVWGASHSKRWVWVHTHGFEENPTAVFEGLWVPIAGSFGMTMCWFQMDGKMSRFTNFGKLWRPDGFLASNRWPLKLEDGVFKLDGSVVVEPSLMAGLTYHDPTGDRRYCYNSKVSTVNLDVTDKKAGEKVILTAPATAAFEICLPHELPQFQMLV
jgi:hypothetical protein